jgi:hypothetical protein
MTRYRADMLLRWEGRQSLVLAEPAPAGSRYLYNPKWADSANFMMEADAIPAFKPLPHWRLLWRAEPEPPAITRLIESSGIAGLIPQGIWHKLRYRHPPVTLYEVPALAQETLRR